MVILLTVSGYAQDPKEFYKTVLQSFSSVHYNPSIGGAIIWDNPSLIHRIEELINADEFVKVMQQAIYQLGNAIDSAIQSNERLVIVSHSAGSLVTELALLTYRNSYRPMISHIMLAPAISGSLYAKMHEFIQPALTLIATKYAVDKTENGWWKLFFGIAGLVMTAKSIANSGVIKQISDGIDPNFLDDKIIRHIIFGDKDEIVNKPNFGYPNSKYYKGNYNHSEVGDLSNNGLKQTYEIYKKRSRLLKSDIIKEAITGSTIF